MTARQPTTSGIEIRSSPGEAPSEVIRNYIEELTVRGHRFIGEPTVIGARCSQCHKDFRIYRPIPRADSVVIYSDFPEEDQCEAQQMNAMMLL